LNSWPKDIICSEVQNRKFSPFFMPKYSSLKRNRVTWIHRFKYLSVCKIVLVITMPKLYSSIGANQQKKKKLYGRVRLSDCWLTPTQQLFSYIIWGELVSFKEMMMRSGVYKTNTITSWIFIVLAHWNNSPRLDMFPHSDTLSWLRANQSLLFLLNAVWRSNP
jgi:hypothetical protein